MSILSLQKRHREIGRLRLGQKGPKGNPVSLSTWRFTSPDKGLLTAVADLYGGEVGQWEDQFEVVSTSDAVPVIVPAQDVNASQSMALWGRGGLIRRCDTETAEIPTDQPNVVMKQSCVCAELDAEGDEKMPRCSPSTLLRFWLPDVPGIGAWVLTSTGWNAAAELATAVELLAGRNVRASLAIEPREVRRQGQPVKKFVVPALRVPVSLSQVLEARTLGTGQEPRRLTAARVENHETGEVTEFRGVVDHDTGEVAHYPVTEEPPHRDDLEQVSAGATTLLDMSEKAIARYWQEIDDLFASGPPDGTMGENETALRKLYRLLGNVGVLPDSDRALHAAMVKHGGFAHVGDMRAAELKEFCRVSWDGLYKLAKEATR